MFSLDHDGVIMCGGYGIIYYAVCGPCSREKRRGGYKRSVAINQVWHLYRQRSSGPFDQEIVSKGYSNRSEAIRDLIRNQLVERDWKDENEEVAGTITLVTITIPGGAFRSFNRTAACLQPAHPFHDACPSGSS